MKNKLVYVLLIAVCLLLTVNFVAKADNSLHSLDVIGSTDNKRYTITTMIDQENNNICYIAQSNYSNNGIGISCIANGNK